jgi:hypothetical protein
LELLKFCISLNHFDGWERRREVCGMKKHSRYFFLLNFSLTICKKWGEKGGWGVEGLYKENPKKDITNTHAKCRGEWK